MNEKVHERDDIITIRKAINKQTNAIQFKNMFN